MGKQVKVMSVDLIKQDIKGKQTDVVAINLLNIEKGSTKKEYIPSFNKLYSAAAVLNEGDICDAAWEKKTVGDKDYFNLAQLTKTGSGGDSVPASRAASKAPTGGSTGYSGGGKSEETQLMIARQNVNNVAMQFVMQMVTQGIYPKKSTPDMLFEEVKRFARKFEGYVTLKDDYATAVAGSGGIEGVPFSTSDDADGMLD